MIKKVKVQPTPENWVKGIGVKEKPSAWEGKYLVGVNYF
tara:strand:+ start:369 stop:485 length:117 start_codon:yes stop_codon:yes gene_type:complete